MSKLEIIKADITTLEVDCIVNAANEQLQEGGGVCGAIFARAGSGKLQRACDNYGFCATGDAVMTPGFGLPARNIIHAVGPVWCGGENGEQEKLYSCYQESMLLAMENGCRSIAFPLISSGIFGYPREDAWKVALSSVRNFQRENCDYELDVIFAVLKNELVEEGQTILAMIDAEIDKTGSSMGDKILKIVRFNSPEDENGFLSNGYICSIDVDGDTFCSVEQYIQYKKAMLFGDNDAAEKIMSCADTDEVLEAGENIAGFNPEEWEKHRYNLLKEALLAKFDQNMDLFGRLVATGKSLPVMCSESDTVNGIGLDMNDPGAANTDNWRGENQLGYALKDVRVMLSNKAAGRLCN